MTIQITKSRLCPIILTLVLLGALTSNSSACENPKHFGEEVLLGFHFGDSPAEVFCEAKRSSPNAALRLDLTNRCRGNRFVGTSRPLAQQKAFQATLEDLYAQALKLRSGNPIDKEMFSRCYDIEALALAGIVKGSDEPSLLVAPAIETTFIVENLAAFEMGYFRTTFGFADHDLSLYERVNVGLGFELAKRKAGQAPILIEVDGQRLYPLWYLSSIQMETYPPKTIEALEKVRKSALDFFKRVHERYPGQISQDNEWDLIIRRKPADVFLKFNEQTGIVTIWSKIKGDQSQAMDDGVRELYKWVTDNRVRAR